MTGSNDTEAVGRLKHTARAVAFGASSLLTTKLLVRGNGKVCYLLHPASVCGTTWNWFPHMVARSTVTVFGGSFQPFFRESWTRTGEPTAFASPSLFLLGLLIPSN